MNEPQYKNKKIILTGEYLFFLNKYKKDISKEKLKYESIDWRCKHIKGFLFYLERKKIKISKLKKSYALKYMNSISNLSTRTKENRCTCIRLFLNYMYKKKQIPFSGVSIFPIIKCNKNYVLPTIYSELERTKILNSIDTNKKDGKRDFVIMILFIMYGIRLKDCSMLTLDNISFEKKLITFIQSKTNYPMILDINPILKYALLDYLKNEYHANESRYLFLDNKNKKLSSNQIQCIFKKYILKSNIDINGRRHGPHSMRHSLASSYIKNNSIYEVANMLGHKNSNDTKAYAKISINDLRKLSLEVPECQI